MKYTTPMIAVLSLALFSADCFAQPPGREKGKRGAAERGERRPGEGRPGEGRPGPGGQRDPAQLVARMMQQFDKDGDKKLNLQELTALFVSLRERREGGGRPQGAEGRGEGEGRGRGKPGAEGQRRRPEGEKQGNAGGEKPRRPPAE